MKTLKVWNHFAYRHNIITPTMTLDRESLTDPWKCRSFRLIWSDYTGCPLHLSLAITTIATVAMTVGESHVVMFLPFQLGLR
jgi:hypothetical protein